MPPVFDESKCTGCGKCTDVCPTDVLRMEGARPAVTYPDECWHCGACMMDCPNGAIKISLPLWMKPITRRIR